MGKVKLSTENIRAIRPGAIEPFLCESGREMEVATVLVTRLKRVGLPDGVVDYETQKFYEKNIFLIHAMKEGDQKVLNK